MLDVMARNWWMLALRGVAAILFGIIVFAAPGIALSALVLVWAVYALVDGVFTIASALQNRTNNPRWWVQLLEGIIGILAGIGVILFPPLAIEVLYYVIAFWAIFTGVLEIIAAIQLRKEIEGEFWLGLSGLLSIIAGILLIVFPLTGLLVLTWLLGGYAIMFGVIMILLAFRLRGMQQPTGTGSSTRQAA
jgi:uncharacterized membrane protein HdeD (DUF308 family)